MEQTAAQEKSWTPLALIDSSATYLLGKGIDSPRLTAELLLAHVLGSARIDLYLNFDKPVSVAERAAFRGFLTRRVAHEPLQYILGTAEFMGLTFRVDRRVLIPRPETEQLVESALSLARTESLSNILDVGTGSGVIAVSLAHFLPGASVDAIDASADALELARQNGADNGVGGRVAFRHADFLLPGTQFPASPFDMIVSNPPYVSKKEFELLPPEVREYEPALATTDDADGLTFFREIAVKGQSLLRGGGRIAAEHAYDQQESVMNIFRDAGYDEVQGAPDYGGVPRIVTARRP